MKTTSNIFFFFLFLSTGIAQEDNNIHKNYIEIGLNNGVYKQSYTGGVQGAFGVFFTSFGKKSAVDLRAKENYTLSPERQAGVITVTYRMYLNKGYYLGGGFAHNHEIALNDYKEDPVRASMGISKHLIHRSGVAVETGYDFKTVLKKGTFGIYPTTNLCMSYLLMDSEPNPFITLSIGLRFGFKKISV